MTNGYTWQNGWVGSGRVAGQNRFGSKRFGSERVDPKKGLFWFGLEQVWVRMGSSQSGSGSQRFSS
ncbi:hypothetical protein HanRHA438_Chr17g0799641 [Helianthus annuus]|nr:hypothetical protein HanRHA438_Chr17g0799641 [Helianthus annuus]